MEGTYGAEAGNMIIVYSGSEPYSMRGQPNIVKFLACAFLVRSDGSLSSRRILLTCDSPDAAHGLAFVRAPPLRSSVQLFLCVHAVLVRASLSAASDRRYATVRGLEDRDGGE
ncbi:hypothetical protein M8818_006054 [Zalaria obscura]|uniref:Uncharacterized protein n=1 Tax=Zalaria obscura TaxID=2024903 RepID=A0ACC3S7U1_9PEZI